MLNKPSKSGGCCRKRFIALTSYDLFKMRCRLKMTTTDMLKAGLVKMEVESGLPVASILLDENGTCPFLIADSSGLFKCQIDSDRPYSCRNCPSEDYIEGIKRYQEIIGIIHDSKILNKGNNKFALGQI